MEEQTQQSSLPPAAAQSRSVPVLWRHPMIVVLCVAVAGLGWQLYAMHTQFTHVREELAKRLSDSDNLAKESSMIAHQAQEGLKSLQANVGLLEAKLAESQGQQAALVAMYQEFSQARDERLLAEVDQAVGIATQQLQLAGNIPAALVALQSANTRLASLNKAQFLMLRKALTHDIDKLKALPVGDVASTTLLLESVLGRIDSLPLGFEHRPDIAQKASAGKDANAGFFERLASDMWHEIKQLVRIERLDRPDPALLAPAQATFLRENLRLRILSARLGLLQHDQRVFYEDIHQARQWVQTYFDVHARSVADTLAELKNIQGMPVLTEIPKLDETLTALRDAQLGGRR